MLENSYRHAKIRGILITSSSGLTWVEAYKAVTSNDAEKITILLQTDFDAKIE